MAELKVSSSTNKERKAIWGEYRTMKEKCMKQGTTKAEFIAHQRQYDGRFGLTDFTTIPKKDPIENMYAIKEFYPRGYKASKEEFFERFW